MKVGLGGEKGKNRQEISRVRSSFVYCFVPYFAFSFAQQYLQPAVSSPPAFELERTRL